ncbi:MAG: DUF1566 domain-containing protein [Deltaproteobacteria bacterium]|nr:DUF1566 domain-containing protein [Deltaproteobacteria bacterium]
MSYTVSDPVKDNVTGLRWQRQAPDGLFTWDEAKSYCAGVEAGGLSGWRLPTRIELVTLLDPSNSDNRIDTEAFPRSPHEDFWSSSSCVGFAGQAWYVNFSHGGVVYAEITAKKRIRCVR